MTLITKKNDMVLYIIISLNAKCIIIRFA